MKMLIYVSLAWAVFSTYQCSQFKSLIDSSDSSVCTLSATNDYMAKVFTNYKENADSTIKQLEKSDRIRVVYKTVYVSGAEPVPVDVLYTDQSVVSIESTAVNNERLKVVYDSSPTDLFIKPPKSFVVQDSSVYLAGTVQLIGVTIDSIAVPVTYTSSLAKTKGGVDVLMKSDNRLIPDQKLKLVYKRKGIFRHEMGISPIQ